MRAALILRLCVRQALARDHDRPAHPAAQLRHAVAVGAGQGVGDIHQFGREVLEHLHVAGWRGEGQDARGVRDEREGLLVEGVEGFGVGRGFGRLGRDRLQFAAGCGCGCGDLGVG